jgi:hypothetical protein
VGEYLADTLVADPFAVSPERAALHHAQPEDLDRVGRGHSMARTVDVSPDYSVASLSRVGDGVLSAVCVSRVASSGAITRTPRGSRASCMRLS